MSEWDLTTVLFIKTFRYRIFIKLDIRDGQFYTLGNEDVGRNDLFV